MAGQWMSRPGADVEFLVGDPKEAAALEATFKKNPQDKSLVGRYRFKGEAPGAEQQPDFMGRLKRWFTEPPAPGSIQAGIESIPGMGLLGAGQRMAAQALLPETNAGAAIDAVTAMAPGASVVRTTARGVLPAVARSVGRVIPPVVAGAVGGATSNGVEGAIEGAKTGAIAGGVGEGMGMLPQAMSAFYQRFGHFNTTNFKRAVRTRLGPQLADAVAEDIPSLARATTLTNTRDLDLLTEPHGGQRVLGRMFDQTEGKIVTALGRSQQRVALPFEALQATGRAGNTPTLQQALASGRATGQVPMNAAAPAASALGAMQGQQVWVDVTPAEAIRISKELRSVAFRGHATPEGQAMRELSDRTTEALLNTVQRVDPRLAGQYTQLREDYGKFQDLVHFLKGDNTSLLPTMPDGAPTIDLPRMYDSLRDSPIDRNRFSNLYNFFEGGTQGGPVAAAKTSLPRAVIGGKGARVAESLPLPGRVRLSRPLEEGMGSAEAINRHAMRTRQGAKVMSVPPIEQMMLNTRENDNEPLPTQLLNRQQDAGEIPTPSFPEEQP